jgi:phage terminase small subunit
MDLTEKQKRFCDYYIETGNAAESYTKAGYKAKPGAARANASRMLTKANIKEYIEKRNKELASARIADMTEVKEFWTSTLRDEEADYKDRLKASEYIAKTNGAFLDKVEQSGDMQLNINIKGSKGNGYRY